MNDLWIKIGFFAFVFAPVWLIVLTVIIELLASKVEFVQKMWMTFALITLSIWAIYGVIFLFVGAAIGADAFTEVWNFFWYGNGLWFLTWCGAGLIEATIIEAINNNNTEHYYGLTCKCILGSAVFFFLMIWLLSVLNLLLPMG